MEKLARLAGRWDESTSDPRKSRTAQVRQSRWRSHYGGQLVVNDMGRCWAGVKIAPPSLARRIIALVERPPQRHRILSGRNSPQSWPGIGLALAGYGGDRPVPHSLTDGRVVTGRVARGDLNTVAMAFSFLREGCRRTQC